MQKAKKNFSTYLGNNGFNTSKATELLALVLEEFNTPAITTDFGPSNPNKSQASVAQAQETLKQQSNHQQTQPATVMSQEDFDNLPDAKPGTVVVKQGPDGRFYYYTADPTKLSFITPTSSTGTQPPISPVNAVTEAMYDFLSSTLFEDSDVIAPIEDLDNPDVEPVKVIKVKIEVESPDELEDDEEEEESKKDKKKKNKKEEDDGDEDEKEEDLVYDPLALLPPLDLSNDIQRAVADAQQDMMPNIRVLPTDVERLTQMRGASRPITIPSQIKGIEEDPYGLSVVGMDNDIALRLI